MAYPKTDSDADRAAAARYRALNSVFSLEAAMQGRYPHAFHGDPPNDLPGVNAGDEKVLHAPLDGIGFHSCARRIVSDASGEEFRNGGRFSGAETPSRSSPARTPLARAGEPSTPGGSPTPSRGRRAPRSDRD